MDLPNPGKVYYSIDSNSAFPTSDCLPPSSSCKLCHCHSGAHPIYFKCPLLNDYICISCCREEVPNESNLSEVQKQTGQNMSLPQIVKTCQSCGNNQFKP